VVTATSDGALAATELEKYVAAMQQRTGLRAAPPAPKQTGEAAPVAVRETADSGALFTEEMRQQLDMVFAKMERKLLLKLYLDDRPVSAELEGFIGALADLSDKLITEVADRQAEPGEAPCVKICLEDGRETGLAFHGIPGGHEFTSFVLGLYNAAGPGQSLDGETKQKIDTITKPTHMKILVTLSCSMCPDLVKAAQRIAAENPYVTAQVYDLHHFEDLKRRYHVMSVPCLIVNDEKVSFGKKNIQQILALLAE
jgi:thioredoxin reductase (NADPH)